MSRIKVFHGTRSADAPRLCDSCVSGVILRGAADSDERVFCRRIEQPVRMRVTECNRYVDRAQPQLWAMKEIAWVLHSDSKRRRVGFLSAKEWRSKNEDEDVVPGHVE
jgi:hypothetical protein